MLDRLPRALSLNAEEREYLFLLAQNRPPEVRAGDRAAITPQLQRVLDAFTGSPAIVKTPEWTRVGWSLAASMVLADYASIPEGERNLFRMLFRESGHDHLPDWKDVARTIVAAVRRDILHAGLRQATRTLIDDLSASSAEFRDLWAEQDALAYGDRRKHIHHQEAGMLAFEYSTFDVDGRPDLALVVFNPIAAEDQDKINLLLAG